MLDPKNQRGTSSTQVIAAIPWLQRLGFKVSHVPGISRAWRYDLANGDFILVTDLGGYDLPDPAGPFAAVTLTVANELVDAQPCLLNSKQLFQWFRRMSRR